MKKKKYNFYEVAMAILGSQAQVNLPEGKKMIRVWGGNGWEYKVVDKEEEECQKKDSTTA